MSLAQDIETTHPLCGNCVNCENLQRAKRTCLGALSGHPGRGEDVRIVWNSCLEAFPCMTRTTPWDQLVAFAKKKGYGVEDLIRWHVMQNLESIREYDDNDLYELLMSGGPFTTEAMLAQFINSMIDKDQDLLDYKRSLMDYFEENDPIQQETEDVNSSEAEARD